MLYTYLPIEAETPLERLIKVHSYPYLFHHLIYFTGLYLFVFPLFCLCSTDNAKKIDKDEKEPNFYSLILPKEAQTSSEHC